MNPWLLTLAYLGLLFPVTSEAQVRDNASGATSSSELPFRLISDYLIQVEGRIGTQTNLKFILDTGATVSIVDEKIADKFSLDRHPAQSFNYDRKLKWESATLPDLQFGPVRATNVIMFVGRLAGYSEFAKNADAVIGMDLLKFSNLGIDFETRKITFHPLMQRAPDVSSAPLLQCPVLEVQVQGHAIHLIVDTGLSGIVLYEERLRKQVLGLRTAGHVVDVTMGGRVHAKQATLPDVLLRKINRDVPVLFVPSPAADILPGIEGITGITLLQAHRIYFDFWNRNLRWD